MAREVVGATGAREEVREAEWVGSGLPGEAEEMAGEGGRGGAVVRSHYTSQVAGTRGGPRGKVEGPRLRVGWGEAGGEGKGEGEG